MGRPKRASSGIHVGNLCHVAWSARLEDQLGTMQLEVTQDLTARVLFEPEGLRLVNVVASFLSAALPERHAYGVLYEATLQLLKEGAGLRDYIAWEVLLLRELGYGLSLSHCAVTGKTDGLLWVSPKSGAAVSQEPARGYEERLLPLPPFLHRGAEPTEACLSQGFDLTGYFMTKHFSSFPFYKTWGPARASLRKVTS